MRRVWKGALVRSAYGRAPLLDQGMEGRPNWIRVWKGALVRSAYGKAPLLDQGMEGRPC